jgi:hypothetical protein
MTKPEWSNDQWGEDSVPSKPLSKQSFGAAARALFESLKNAVPPGAVREEGHQALWGIPLDPFKRTVDWFSDPEADASSNWNTSADFGFASFVEVVAEVAAEAKPVDAEIWGEAHTGQTLETAIAKGHFNEKLRGERATAEYVWEQFSGQIDPGELPVMMTANGYGTFDSIRSAGAGIGCGLTVLVSDDKVLRSQWLKAVETGINNHWSGTIMGLALRGDTTRPILDPASNRGILPIFGDTAIQSIRNMRSGKGYDSKRILVVGNLNRVASANTRLVGEIMAAGREGSKSGNVGVVAMMGVDQYTAWMHSPDKYWNLALRGASIVTGGFADYDVRARVANAYMVPFGGGEDREIKMKLMELEKTRVAVLLGPGRIEEGWLLG